VNAKGLIFVFGDIREEETNGGTSQCEEGSQIVVVDSKVNRQELYETVAHETVNAIQFMKGIANRVGLDVIEWKAERYDYYRPLIQIMLTSRGKKKRTA